MFEAVKDIFRRQCLKKHSSMTRTGFIPLDEIHSAMAVIDGSDPRCMEYSNELESFFRKYGIGFSGIFIDQRKNEPGMSRYSAPERTICRKDINWFGMPKSRRKGHLYSSKTDLLVNLLPSSDYISDYLSKAIDARMKIGSMDYPDNPFDIVIPGNTIPDRTWDKIESILKFIKQIV